jgi:hypothetical protein
LSEAAPGSLFRRLAWMVAIWTASVLALAIVAMLIRWAIKP